LSIHRIASRALQREQQKAAHDDFRQASTVDRVYEELPRDHVVLKRSTPSASSAVRRPSTSM
jgi:hypothetical protein